MTDWSVSGGDAQNDCADPHPLHDTEAGGEVVADVSLVERESVPGADSALHRTPQIEALESLQDIFCTLDRSFRVTYVNRAAETGLAFSRQEILGKTLQELLPHELAEVALAHAQLALERNEPLSYERYDADQDRWFEQRISPFADGLSVAILDVTERKRAQDQLASATQMLDLALEAGEVGTWVWDIPEDAYHWSDSFYRLFGLERGAQASSETWLSLVHPEDRETAVKNINRSIRDGSLLVNDYRIIRPDGRLRWISAHGRAVYDEDGNPVRLMGVCLDISHRKETEERLRMAQKRLRMTTEAAGVGLWKLDLPANELSWDRQHKRIFGLPEDAPVTLDLFLSLVEPELRGAVMDKFRAAIDTGLEYNDEYCIRLTDGQRRWMQARGRVDYDESGTPLMVLGIVMDVTDRRMQEHALHDARADAERRAAEMDACISSLTDGLVVYDRDLSITIVNDAARAVFGPPPEVSTEECLRGHPLYHLDGTPVENEMWPSTRALRGETVKNERLMIATPWREAILSVSASPVRDPDGSVVGGVLSLRDISEEVALQRDRDVLHQKEHHIAEVLQNALKPNAYYSVPGAEVSVLYRPASDEASVGGDFYDIFQLDRGRYGLLIGDVAGKGLTAAIRVAAAVHTIRGYAYIEPAPDRVLQLANNALCKDPVEEVPMLTAFYAVLDTDSGEITCANGGHEAPMLIRMDGTVEELCAHGVALGVIEDECYSEETESLSAGDVIVLFTDGITEARTAGRNLFGSEGVKTLLAQTKSLQPVDSIAESVVKAASDYAGGDLRDDVAVVVLRYAGSGG